MASTLTLPRAETRPAPARLARRALYWAPLILIMAAQAVYTIRLVPLGYLSTDEARYIVAGHALIHELFHGGGSPYYETYFSGAPDVYSPLAAMADYVGGIAAVRLMSVCFMLTATWLLFRTSRLLIGYVGAVCSAGLFAGLGMTQVVGRNTIYDALAFTVMALAGYVAARSREGEAKWLLLLPLVLFAAYFTKYMTILFDPVAIAVASLGVGTWRDSARRFFALGLATTCALVVGVFLAGRAYLQGMVFTVFSRQSGANHLLGAERVSDQFIVTHAWSWMGALVLLSVLAVGAAVFRNRQLAPVLAFCAFAGLLVSLEALHLHSNESMRRHDVLGAWFAAIPAGYLMGIPAQIARSLGWKRVLAGAAFAALVPVWAIYSQPASTFTHQSGYDTGNAGDPAPLSAYLKPYLLPGREYLLSGLDNFATIYYTHNVDRLPWYEYATDDNYIKYPIPGRGGDWSGQVLGRTCYVPKPGCVYLEGPAGYRAAIKAHAFALIELSREGHRYPPIGTDPVIDYALRHTQGYIRILQRGHFSVWIYASDYKRAQQ